MGLDQLKVQTHTLTQEFFHYESITDFDSNLKPDQKQGVRKMQSWVANIIARSAARNVALRENPKALTAIL